MRKFKMIFNGIVVAVLMMLITSFKIPPLLAYSGNAHVNGGGTTVEGGAKSTFTFNAVQHADGNVTGHLVYQVRVTDIKIKMDIDCMNINGNTAVLSGVVTQADIKEGDLPWFIFVGQRGTFTVVDNGQGKNALPDQISDLILFPTASCAVAVGTYLPISGNIDIKE